MRLRCSSWFACLALPFTVVACGGDASQHPTGDAGIDAGGERDAGSPGDGGAHAEPDAQRDASVELDASLDAGPNALAPRWFESREPLQLKLSGALGDAFRAAFAGMPDGIFPPDRKKDPFPASVAYPNLDATAHVGSAVLALRGNSSLQECAFPKLKLSFEARIADPNDPFVGTKKVKIGTHCGEEDSVNGNIGRLRNEVAAYREEVVYQLARALSITTLQTRPALIEYTDTSSEQAFASPLTRKAFLLEHIDELARRLGAKALQDPIDCGPDPDARPDPEAVLRVKFFHAMVGNWDWALGPPETSGCGSLMNTEVLAHPDGTLTLVPADFDLSALVVGEVRNPENNQLETTTADNAVASARHYLTPSLEGESSAAIAKIRAEYLAKQGALQTLLDDSLMDAEGKRLAKLLLAGFFSVLAE